MPNATSIIIGLNAYHGDSAACLFRDGVLVAAAEEERFRRIKHWAGFPSQAIDYCLKETGITLEDVDHVAINTNPRANLIKKFSHVLFNRPEISLTLDRLKNQKERQSIECELAQAFPQQKFGGQIHRVEHHTAHLASCFLVSPFREAAIASIDGFGDFSSAAWGIGRGSEIDITGRVYFPHSLGVFYQALTQYLGFPHYGDEYKVMGLAPYGSPRHLSEMRQIVKLKENGSFELELKHFRHHREKIDYAWDGGSPHVGTLFTRELEALLGPARAQDEPLEDRHRDIARSVQEMYEEAFFHLLDHLHTTTRSDSLAIAGGCGMNSVANGKVLRRGPFKRLFVQSAAGDAGGAIGAALSVWTTLGVHRGNRGAKASYSILDGDPDLDRPVMDHAYLGPSASDAEVEAILKDYGDQIAAAGCSVEYLTEEDLLARTADAISEGRVVGWFQGRMEWGPRALGNRSILGDPRRADMKDILNLKIKRRESFRPFAPSILKEHVADWFEEDGDVPFMMQVFQIREERRAQIPAVTHADGSGRLQTVYRKTNERYWSLIEAFRQKTGVPMVLNTSFNENEPVVCRPEEALDCFLRTKMDVLVLGNVFICRQ